MEGDRLLKILYYIINQRIDKIEEGHEPDEKIHLMSQQACNPLKAEEEK